MKKIIAGILSGGLLMCLLTGCSPVKVQVGGNNDTEGGNDTKIETEAAPMVYHTVTLPSQYFITYEVSGEDGIVRTVSKAVDADGNIYYGADQEYLFLLEGKNYILYQPENGTLTRQGSDKYQPDYIKKLTKDFGDYVEKAGLTFNQTPTGQVTVVGRDCDVYAISIKFANYEQRYQYAFDQETYACLEVKSEKNISGFEKEGDDGFTCVRFDTEQIDLPKEFLESRS